LGIILAVYAMQARVFHLKFPEVQRSRFHQLKARVPAAAANAAVPTAACVLLYAFRTQQRLTFLEAGCATASFWPVAMCVFVCWSIVEVHLTERVQLHLGEPTCPNLSLIAGLMARQRNMDNKVTCGLLRYHSYLDFYMVSKFDFRRRVRLYEDKRGNSWNEIVDAITMGLLAPMANDLDSLSAVAKDGALEQEGELEKIARGMCGLHPKGNLGRIAGTLGLNEYVRDPFSEVQLAVWGLRGLGSIIAKSITKSGNLQVDRYGIVQDSACEIAGHITRLINSLHEYARALQKTTAKKFPLKAQSAVMLCPKFKMLASALNLTLYQVVATFHGKPRPNAPLLPRHGVTRRWIGPDDQDLPLSGKVIELHELPKSYNAGQKPVDEEAKFSSAMKELHSAQEDITDTVQMQRLAQSGQETHLRQLEKRESELQVERDALLRHQPPSRMQTAQRLFETERWTGQSSQSSMYPRPAISLGEGPSYDFPHEATAHLESYGGLAANINPTEPNGSGSVESLRLAVIQEELARIQREKLAVSQSEIRLHREIDGHADTILSAEQKVLRERDDALLKRAKRNTLLYTLQGIVRQYESFFAGTF